MRTRETAILLATLCVVAFHGARAEEPVCNTTLPVNSNTTVLQAYLDTVTDGYPVTVCIPSGEFAVTISLSNPLTSGGSSVTLAGAGSEGPDNTTFVPDGASALVPSQTVDFALYHAAFNMTTVGGTFSGATLYLEDIVIIEVGETFLTTGNGNLDTLVKIRATNMSFEGDLFRAVGDAVGLFTLKDSYFSHVGPVLFLYTRGHFINVTFIHARGHRYGEFNNCESLTFEGCEFAYSARDAYNPDFAQFWRATNVQNLNVLDCDYHDIDVLYGAAAIYVLASYNIYVNNTRMHDIVGSNSGSLVNINNNGPVLIENTVVYDVDDDTSNGFFYITNVDVVNMTGVTFVNNTYHARCFYLGNIGEVFLNNLLVENNYASYVEVAFFIQQSGSAVISDTVIRNNTCGGGTTVLLIDSTPTNFYDSSFDDNYNEGYGWGIDFQGGDDVNFTRCNFTDNFAQYPMFGAQSTNVFLDDCEVSCNGGGAFRDQSGDSVFTLSNTRSFNNFEIDPTTGDYPRGRTTYPDDIMLNTLATGVVGYVRVNITDDPRSCVQSPPLDSLNCQNSGVYYYDRVNAFFGACDCSGTGYVGTECTIPSTTVPSSTSSSTSSSSSSSTSSSTTSSSPMETTPPYETPLETTSSSAPIVIVDEGCESDEWDSPLDGCVPCPLGAYCNGTRVVWPLPGFWSRDQYSEPVECGVPSACPGTIDDEGELVCDKKGRGQCKHKDKKDKGNGHNRNLLSAYNNETEPVASWYQPATDVCNNKYRNFACADCDSDHFRDNQRCFDCGPNGVANAAGLIVVNLFIIGSIAVFSLFLKDKFLDKYVSLLMAVQLFIVTGKDFSRHIPDPVGAHVATGYRWLSVLNFDVEFMQLDCLAGEPYEFPQIFFATIALFALSIGVFVFTAVLYTAYVTARGKTSLPFSRTVLNRSIHVLVVLGMAGYLQIGLRVFQAFDCVSIYGDDKLHVQYSIQCGTADHSSTLILAVIVFIYYILGFPAFIFYVTFHRPGAAADFHRSGVLVKNYEEFSATASDSEGSGNHERKKEYRPADGSLDPSVVDYIQRYGFLVRELRPGAFWFQSFKFVIMFTVVLQLALPRSAGVKLLTNACVLLTNVLLIGLIWPYTSLKTNGMNMLTGTLTALQTAVFLTNIVDVRFQSGGATAAAFLIVAAVIGLLFVNIIRNKSLCYPDPVSEDITSIHEEDGVRVGRLVRHDSGESGSIAYSEDDRSVDSRRSRGRRERRRSSSSFSVAEGLAEVSEIESSSL